MVPYIWLENAQERLAPHIRTTPLGYDQDRDLYIKWENRQVTGSFKARGALNKVLCLQPWERERGLVAASAGNHGQGVALAGNLFTTPVTIFASEHAVATKVQAMRDLGATVVLVPGGYGEAEKAGLDYAASHACTWISPYNDPQIIAGQGSLGLEIQDQLPNLSQAAWIVPAGGGGLISGIGAALKSSPVEKASHPHQLIGVQSEASPFLHSLYHHGTQAGVIELSSLADGLSGPVQEGSVTIPLVRSFLDDFILVSETEIRQAIRFAWSEYQERIEGSAAVGLAAIISGKITTRPAVVIISGGNIPPEVHAEIIHGE
jgi:threonine dehydratase